MSSRTAMIGLAAGLMAFATQSFSQKQEPAKAEHTQRSQAAQARFQSFLTRFKQAVRTNDIRKISNGINFPFYVYSGKHSRTEFVSDKTEAINIFTSYIRNQIIQSTMADFLVYRNKGELGQAGPDVALIPADSPVFELDVMNNHGGPAMRFLFAETGEDFKLFCLAQ